MPELVAQGPRPENHWRLGLPARAVTLGRTRDSEWRVPWDNQVSGFHATLKWEGGRLLVRRRMLPKPTSNPVYFKGRPCDEFAAAPGEGFVIGDTTFRVADAAATPELPTPLTELTCSAEELGRHQYTDANERIEVLAALPGVIRFSPSDAELESRVVDALLRGIPRAEAAAVVRVVPGGEGPAVGVRAAHCRNRPAADFHCSRRLVLEALDSRGQAVMHVWQSGGKDDFTALPGYDWAVCVPLPDDPDPGWGLYLTGRLPEPAAGGPTRDDLLKSDLKFAEVVAEVFGALRQVIHLQRRQGQLLRFLSRPVLAALAGRDLDEVLRPRPALVTVLFCDLRGSCRIAEQCGDELTTLWARVSAALGAMSRCVLDEDGVIGDFQGDAVMGFWGWPLEEPDQVERAARAALAIRRRFAEDGGPGGPLAGFSCGLGIAHGNAIAGRLGTADQFKVDVFGPVVNLASRLESMTKRLGVAALLDEASGRRLSDPAKAGWVRARRLARVQPFGMEKRLTVYELMPPEGDPGARPAAECAAYEAVLGDFLAGRWAEAREGLGRLSGDGAAAFLASHLLAHAGGPPTGWDGTIPLDAK